MGIQSLWLLAGSAATVSHGSCNWFLEAITSYLFIIICFLHASLAEFLIHLKRRIEMEKVDNTFAHDMGFEFEHHGTWFVLHSTGAADIRGSIVDGIAKDVRFSFEAIPNCFEAICPDIAEAYANRIIYISKLAKCLENLPVEKPLDENQ